MLKVKKFEECTCMRLYSVKQNIEGGANLHHPRNRVNYQHLTDTNIIGVKQRKGCKECCFEIFN